LTSKLLSMIGSQAKVMVDSIRLRPSDSEVYRLISDNGLARKSLGWQPQTDLDRGLEQTVSWIKKHLDLYRVGAYEF
jgi:nucleoside-diphosphate-sugar epimerase